MKSYQLEGEEEYFASSPFMQTVAKFSRMWVTMRGLFFESTQQDFIHRGVEEVAAYFCTIVQQVVTHRR